MVREQISELLAKTLATYGFSCDTWTLEHPSDTTHGDYATNVALIVAQQAETLLDNVGITLNKNMIADDLRKPMDESDIRLGTPVITARWLTEKECTYVAELMIRVLKNQEDSSLHEKTRKDINEIAYKHPAPDVFM